MKEVSVPMFEIELKYKINGREVRCDQFVDAIKTQLTEAIKDAIQQQRSAEPSPQSSPQMKIPAERHAYGLDEASKLLSVSKATISRRIREGKIRAIRVGSRVLLPSESIQKILQEAP
jgi:excisionase family DNA binding protein